MVCNASRTESSEQEPAETVRPTRVHPADVGHVWQRVRRGRRPRAGGRGGRAQGRAPVPPLRGARIRRSDQCVSYVWGAPDAGALLFF